MCQMQCDYLYLWLLICRKDVLLTLFIYEDGPVRFSSVRYTDVLDRGKLYVLENMFVYIYASQIRC